MYDYLTQTQCQVPIDHFCFDLAVDCLNEFRHSRQHSFLPVNAKFLQQPFAIKSNNVLIIRI